MSQEVAVTNDIFTKKVQGLILALDPGFKGEGEDNWECLTPYFIAKKKVKEKIDLDQPYEIGCFITDLYYKISEESNEPGIKSVDKYQKWSSKILAVMLNSIKDDLMKGTKEKTVKFVKSLSEDQLQYIATVKDNEESDEDVSVDRGSLLIGMLWHLVELPTIYFGKDTGCVVEKARSTSLYDEIVSFVLNFANSFDKRNLGNAINDYLRSISELIEEITKCTAEEYERLQSKSQRCLTDLSEKWIDILVKIVTAGISTSCHQSSLYVKNILEACGGELGKLLHHCASRCSQEQVGFSDSETSNKYLAIVGKDSLEILKSIFDRVVNERLQAAAKQESEQMLEMEEEKWENCKNTFVNIYKKIQEFIDYDAENPDISGTSFLSNKPSTENWKRTAKTILEACKKNISFLCDGERVITITGSVSAGKSSFINALLEKDILPVGKGHTTSGMIRISADKNGLYGLNGQRMETHDALKLELEKSAVAKGDLDKEMQTKLLLQAKTKTTKARVDEKHLFIDLPEDQYPFLSGKTTIIDSPGMGYSRQNNLLVAEEGCSRILVLVADAEKEISNDDVEKVREMTRDLAGNHIILCNNKWDMFDEKDKKNQKEKILGRCRFLLWQIRRKYLPDPEKYVFFVSSKEALLEKQGKSKGNHKALTEFNKLAMMLKTTFTKRQVEEQGSSVIFIINQLEKQIEKEKGELLNNLVSIMEKIGAFMKQSVNKKEQEAAENEMRLYLSDSFGKLDQKLNESNVGTTDQVKDELKAYKIRLSQSLARKLDNIVDSQSRQIIDAVNLELKNYDGCSKPFNLQHTPDEAIYRCMLQFLDHDEIFCMMDGPKFSKYEEAVKTEKDMEELREKAKQEFTDKQKRGKAELRKEQESIRKTIEANQKKIQEAERALKNLKKYNQFRGKRRVLLGLVSTATAVAGGIAVGVVASPLVVPSAAAVAAGGFLSSFFFGSGWFYDKNQDRKEKKNITVQNKSIEDAKTFKPDTKKEIQLIEKIDDYKKEIEKLSETQTEIHEDRKCSGLKSDCDRLILDINSAAETFCGRIQRKLDSIESEKRQKICSKATSFLEEEMKGIQEKYDNKLKELHHTREEIEKFQEEYLVSDILSSYIHARN